MANYFAILDLAGDEDGEAAVAKVVGKKKAQAQAAEIAAAEKAAAEKDIERSLYFPQRRDSGNRYGGPGRGRYQGGGDRGGRGRDYDSGFHYDNNGRYYHGNGDHGQGYYENNGQYQRHREVYNGEDSSHAHVERSFEGGNYYNNGGRQGHGGTRGKNMQYRPKEKPSSDAAAENSPEEKVVDSAAETEQKTSADNADAVPASESEKTTGDDAKGESEKAKDGDSEKKKKEGDSEKKKNINGSLKRKMKKQDPKVDDPKKRTDGDLKKADEEQVVKEEEKKDMTFDEYEKVLKEKKKSFESKSEERKVTVEDFQGLQVLEKKRDDDDDDASNKAENFQRVKERKAHKPVSINKFLQPADAKEYAPRPPRQHGQEEAHYRGSGAPGRGNGGFRAHSRNSSSESQAYDTGRARVTNDRGNGYQDHRDRGYHGQQRNGGSGNVGGYTGGEANGGYQQGAGNGGYRQGSGYSGNGGYRQGGGYGNGGYRQGSGYSGNGNGGYRQGGGYGNGDYRQGGRNGNGNGGYRQGGYSGNGDYRHGGGNGGLRRNNNQREPEAWLNSVKDFPALALNKAEPAAKAPSAPPAAAQAPSAPPAAKAPSARPAAAQAPSAPPAAKAPSAPPAAARAPSGPPAAAQASPKNQPPAKA